MITNLFLPHSDTATLAVVPIFVNAGAALLPTLVAGAGSVVMLLFKPKEIGRASCRERV